jgi:hypothetical protein
MTMRKSRRISPLLLGLALVALPALLTDAYAGLPEVQSPVPGMARVWFLRASGLTDGAAGAAPMLFANGAPLSTLPAGSEFFPDFPAGTYRFTVQPYGPLTGEADTLKLAAGTQTYLQVNWLPGWMEGYPGSGPESDRLFVQTMAPQPAQAYLPSLTDLGRR